MRAGARCLALVVLFAGGCRGTATEIVVSVASDLSVPDPLHTFGLQVFYLRSGHLESQVDKSWTLVPPGTSGVSLPATVALFPGANLDEKLEIVVSGKEASSEQPMVSRRARLHFVKGRILLLRMALLSRCLGKTTCKDNETCGENGCEPVEKDPNQLPDYTDEEALRGLEAGIGGDARPDSTSDRTHVPDEPLLRVESGPDKIKTSDLPPCVAPTGSQNCPGGWCTIGRGCFMMGAPSSDQCAPPSPNNETYHRVTIKHNFEISATEVTVAQFESAMGYLLDFSALNTQKMNPHNCPGCAASVVTWHQAAAYCNKLSSGKYQSCFNCTGTGSATNCSMAVSGDTYQACTGYRLSTEAEWEYAARAGKTTSLLSGDLTLSQCGSFSTTADQAGWFAANSTVGSEQLPKVAGNKGPNNWGLFDMHGNVWEWVADGSNDLLKTPAEDPFFWWGSTKVARGGCFQSPASDMRSSRRVAYAPTQAIPQVGFRCLRTLP